MHYKIFLHFVFVIFHYLGQRCGEYEINVGNATSGYFIISLKFHQCKCLGVINFLSDVFALTIRFCQMIIWLEQKVKNCKNVMKKMSEKKKKENTTTAFLKLHQSSCATLAQHDQSSSQGIPMH